MKINESSSFHNLCLDIIGNIAENSLRSCKNEDITSLYNDLRQVENVLESYYALPIARKKLWDLGQCYKCCDLWTKMYLKYNSEENKKIVNETNRILMEEIDRDDLRNNYMTIMLNAEEYMRNSEDKSSMINYLLQATKTEKILPWKFNVFFCELKNVYKKCNNDQKIYFKRWMGKYFTEQDWTLCQTELKDLLSSFASWYDYNSIDLDQLVKLLNM
jgi:hypothetical protein